MSAISCGQTECAIGYACHSTGWPSAMSASRDAMARATGSRDALLALGYPVEWHEYPMQHSVCPQEIADMNRWLLKVLA